MEWLVAMFGGLCAVAAGAFVVILKIMVKRTAGKFPPPPTEKDMQ